MNLKVNYMGAKDLSVRIKRLDPDVTLPSYATDGSAAIDITSNETKTLEPGEIHRFRTGFVIATPKGHVLILADRSSNPVKKGITFPHGIGVIDSDYSGDEDELLIQVQNMKSEPVTIEKGQVIAQGFIVEIPRITLEEVEEMESQSRGGFGSTGN